MESGLDSGVEFVTPGVGRPAEEEKLIKLKDDFVQRQSQWGCYSKMELAYVCCGLIICWLWKIVMYLDDLLLPEIMTSIIETSDRRYSARNAAAKRLDKVQAPLQVLKGSRLGWGKREGAPSVAAVLIASHPPPFN